MKSRFLVGGASFTLCLGLTCAGGDSDLNPSDVTSIDDLPTTVTEQTIDSLFPRCGVDSLKPDPSSMCYIELSAVPTNSDPIPTIESTLRSLAHTEVVMDFWACFTAKKDGKSYCVDFGTGSTLYMVTVNDHIYPKLAEIGDLSAGTVFNYSARTVMPRLKSSRGETYFKIRNMTLDQILEHVGALNFYSAPLPLDYHLAVKLTEATANMVRPMKVVNRIVGMWGTYTYDTRIRDLTQIEGIVLPAQEGARTRNEIKSEIWRWDNTKLQEDYLSTLNVAGLDVSWSRRKPDMALVQADLK